MSRPRLLRPVGAFLALWGGTLFLVPVFAVAGVGSFSINGEPVSGPEFLARICPFALPVGAYALVLARGLWRERRWARPLTVGFVPIASVGAGLTAAFNGSGFLPLFFLFIVSLLWTGIAVWYFYMKLNVTEYYDRLGRDSGSPLPSPARDGVP